MPTIKANRATPQRDDNLGESLRRIRKQKEMTLTELGEKCGMPISTISKIENNKMSLTYDRLLQICQALDIDLSQLFTGSATGEETAVLPSGRRSLNRHGTGYAIDTPNYAHLFPAADLLHKRAVPIIGKIHARKLEDFGALISHPGEEFAIVLKGTVDLYSDLYTPVRLETGDSIYFDSGMAHAYIAAGEGPCRVLSVCTSDEANAETMYAALIDPSGPATHSAGAREKTDLPPAAPKKTARKSN